MIRRIVIPLDESTLAESAIPFGCLLATTTGASIELVSVIDATPTDAAEATVVSRRYLRSVQHRFAALASAIITTRIGHAAEQIRLVADAMDTLIVMATHGAGGLRRMLLGSVADAVVRTATVPVVLIRCHDTPDLRSPTIRRLLVPLDGSELSNRAIPVAVDLAGPSQAELHLLRVVEPLPADQTGYLPDAAYLSPTTYTEIMDDIEGAARDDLQVAAQICRDAGIEPVTHMMVSTPIDGILRTATSIAADAIVMATHGRGGVRRMVLGSVATGLVQTSDLPLIVIPVHALAGSATQELGGFDADVKQEADGVI